MQSQVIEDMNNYVKNVANSMKEVPVPMARKSILEMLSSCYS